jgi:hypothetical protein
MSCLEITIWAEAPGTSPGSSDVMVFTVRVFGLTKLVIRGDKSFWKSKRIYEIVLPLAVAAPLFALFLSVPQAFAKDFLSVFSQLLFQFMVFVVPFHLAALAAFATFERSGLDERLQGTNAEIFVWNNKDNTKYLETLTLRQYASLLFGYLCSIGIMFIVSYLFIVNINFSYLLDENYIYAYKATTFVVLLFITHYAFLSIYSITFLFDKINKIGS